MQILQFIFGFALTIGILVAVHEWGHYWVAKRLGVKILRFSIGMGKPLWSKQFGPDKTEFVLAAIPLGGYVQMLDEHSDDIRPEERHRAFHLQPLWVRAAIVAAGPLINLAFAVIVFTLMFMLGVEGPRPVIGTVTPDTPAAHAGLQVGYEIIEVDGQSTKLWGSVMQASLQGVMDKRGVEYHVRTEDGREDYLTLNLDNLSIDDFTKSNLPEKLGIDLYVPSLPPVIAKVMPDMPAAQAGFQPGDEIVSMQGQAINDWMDWVRFVQQHPDQLLSVEILRNKQTLSLELRPLERDGVGVVGLEVQRPETWPPENYLTIEHYGLLTAFIKGIDKTWSYSVLTVRMLGKMLVAEVSIKNISGPVTIAEYAGYSLRQGLASFLLFLGLVSIGLGILNLLPIPVLDGGHLLLYLIEWLKGKPLSEQSLAIFNRVGLTLVLMLMTLALYNDFNRLLQ